MENTVRYIIRASFSRERMTYLPDEASAKAGHRETGQVEYQSKDGKETKVLKIFKHLDLWEISFSRI